LTAKRGDVMDFTLRELDKKETLSLYKRYLTKFFDEESDGFLISESAIRWLIARKICSCYGLFDDKKHLFCFGLFINDIEQRVMLLDYFGVLKKYSYLKSMSMIKQLSGIRMQKN